MDSKHKEKSLSQRQKKICGVVTLLLVAAFLAAVTWFVGKPMIEFISEPERFRAWVGENAPLSYLAFIGMVVFQVIVAVVPGEPLEIGAGYAFGAVCGTLLCMAGITIGSIIIFLLVRKFGIRLIEVFFSREKILSLRFLQNEKRFNLIVFIIFFIPGTPKDLLSYFIGLTDMKLSSWIFIAAVARIPSIITSTIGGSALGVQNYVTAIIVFALTAALSLAGMVIYRLLQNRNK